MWARATTVVFVSIAAVLAQGCGDDGSSAPAERAGGQQVTVRVGGDEVRADVADTDQERAAGLSGRAALARDQGMLFEFPAASRPAFWMRGMRFPIDIVWIARGRVTEVTARAPVPRPGTSESELPLYRPRRNADRVLEVSAGWARRNGVGPGDAVAISR